MFGVDPPESDTRNVPFAASAATLAAFALLMMPGPVSELRPTLPRRLKHSGGGARNAPLPFGCALGGAGSQFAFQNAKLGAVGTVKQSVLM